MTLTIMNVALWGVWTCSDHRLTPLDGQGEPTDMSVKQIILRSADGEALITYSGMGTVEDDVHLSEWLRRLLRNENWNLDQIQILIRNWATAKWGATLCARGRPHWFLVGGFSHGCPLAAEITNSPGPPGSWPLPHFEIRPYPVDTAPQLLVRGAGREAICGEDWSLLERMRNRRPQRTRSWMRVLAAVHRRAQRSGLPGSETVSEACMTMGMPPNYGTPETGGLEQLFHWTGTDAEPGGSLPPVPLLVKGLDMTTVYEADHLIRPYLEAGQVPPEEARERWSEAIKHGMVAPPNP